MLLSNWVYVHLTSDSKLYKEFNINGDINSLILVEIMCLDETIKNDGSKD